MVTLTCSGAEAGEIKEKAKRKGRKTVKLKEQTAKEEQCQQGRELHALQSSRSGPVADPVTVRTHTSLTSYSAESLRASVLSVTKAGDSLHQGALSSPSPHKDRGKADGVGFVTLRGRAACREPVCFPSAGQELQSQQGVVPRLRETEATGHLAPHVVPTGPPSPAPQNRDVSAM
ncbi:hypothetical protein TREES_T100017092 [Tupaia chinensis]|uniref:Uncharacterized protein n=1 Tax=Tupaia chinensis TaxID=246437 RepID=L9KQC5_TUPCH|nr:hypothetical protein TREES_T100017092 [Tupaia chinensis]